MKVLSHAPWRTLAAYAVLAHGLYVLAASWQWRTPLVIAPSRLDEIIPLVPAASYLYLTYPLLLPVLIVALRRRPELGYVLGAGLACNFLNLIAYLVVPSELADRAVAPAGSLLQIIYAVDVGRCVFPSGHVALPAAIVTAALLAGRMQWVAILFGLWAAILAATALLTKQHYVVDILAGAVFGPLCAIGALALLRTCERRSSEDSERRRPVLHLPTLRAFFVEWTLIVLVMIVALESASAIVAALAMPIIATRQHALLVLYHDAVHGLIARSRRLNDFIVNLAVAVPLLLPLNLYRALHLSHHRHLGTPLDPERVVLYRNQPWSFRPLGTVGLVRQLIGELTLWNTVAMIYHYLRERGPGGGLKLPRTRIYPESIAQYAIALGALVGAFAAWPMATTYVMVLWFAPYYTLTQLLQKIRSFAEHATTDAESSLSCSWSPGLIGRLTIWPYNINYHREHHARPKVPWSELPAAFPVVQQRPGTALLAHVWSGASR